MKTALTIFSLFLALAFGYAESKRPNILFIMADDCTYSDLPLYGGENVDTPNIDRLAREGMTFDQAYVSMSMCVPCRASLHTGLFPFKSGVAWNHSKARKGLKTTPHYLEALGYRVGLAGKIHLNPPENYPFEWVEGVDRDAVAVTADYDAAPLKEFMSRDPEQPFALTVAFNSPHAPWTVGDPGQFDPEKFKLPPDLPDTKVLREEFAKYLAEVVVLDEQVGMTIDLLDELGIADSTIVFFSSEQGAQFPGAKWTNWAAGVKSALVARWPGKIEANVRTQAIVQYCDILPTLIEIAGGDSKGNGFDGSSFEAALLGESESHREFAYFMHNNLPEGSPYPIRGVTDGKFHYIRNLSPERAYVEKHLYTKVAHNAYMPSFFWEATTRPKIDDLLQRFMARPAEQLYDNEKDPFQLKNIAGSKEEARARLSDALDAWMEEQGDPGVEMDSRAFLKAARAQKHTF